MITAKNSKVSAKVQVQKYRNNEKKLFKCLMFLIVTTVCLERNGRCTYVFNDKVC